MKKIAHAIHHTHWDPIWYFTAEEATVQFAYNMKELLRRFEEGRVTTFFLDGQTAVIDDYLRLHPEDQETIRKLVEEGNLNIGPFNSQLDCFISSGESVVNNLRLGIESADRLGGSSKIAYLPDSFGHSRDFPKIFNQFGIRDFVITRGVGDEYGLKNEFYMESNDRSRLLVATMLAGYGYGTYGFRDGTLLTDQAEDYNKINIHDLIDRLVERSTLKNEFVFPIGFDQNPAILDIEEKIRNYNEVSKRYSFRKTTWEAYLNRVREQGEDLRTHRGELYSTQFHRIHRSIFSARADIKRIQDQTERTLTFEVQPLMSMLDHIAVSYDHALIDEAWDKLIRCQTHSSATLTDETNAYILQKSKSAFSLANAIKIYLMKIVAISKAKTEKEMPLVIYHTLPRSEHIIRRLRVYTKHTDFRLVLNERTLPYTLIEQKKKDAGVKRKNPSNSERKPYYESLIAVEIKDFGGIGYQTVYVHDGVKGHPQTLTKKKHSIENERYAITVDDKGIHIRDNETNRTVNSAIYFEDSGDEGDNYDYSYPEDDRIITHDLSDASVEYAQQTNVDAKMAVKGSFMIPAGLETRREGKTNRRIDYRLTVSLKKGSPIIDVRGKIDNKAKNHRMRLVLRGDGENGHSYAGTQYGCTKRPTAPEEMDGWREKGYFEEPSPHYPLLNFVATRQDDHTTAAFTRSVKEYEFIGPGKEDIALTLFRSVGHLGLPDLNRRPGRPSGLANKIFETPDSQMLGEQTFRIGLGYYGSFDENRLMDDYVRYATDLLYYQNQPYKNTVFNMAYFPTNPLDRTPPDAYELLRLDKGPAVFGTLTKSKQKGYLLRMFNAGDDRIPFGKIHTNTDNRHMKIVDFLENEINGSTSNLSYMAPGQIMNVLIRPAENKTDFQKK